MNIYVTKADGSQQLFDKEKIVKTCVRMGANRQIAYDVAKRVEKMLFDGISTEKILQITFRLLRKHKPTIRHLLDLRKGLSVMNSKPEFELFIQVLLSKNGYEVTPNQIIRGKCVEHEVDAVAKKEGKTYFVEAKHHANYHTPTGLDESRIARAILEDITEGSELSLNNLNINKAMIVTNTRFSQHAKRYGECRNILQIGWSSPLNHGLQDMIEKEQLHPFTCLKGIDRTTRRKLVSARIILMKQLVEAKPAELSESTGISPKTLARFIGKARSCTYTMNNP